MGDFKCQIEGTRDSATKKLYKCINLGNIFSCGVPYRHTCIISLLDLKGVVRFFTGTVRNCHKIRKNIRSFFSERAGGAVCVYVGENIQPIYFEHI